MIVTSHRYPHGVRCVLNSAGALDCRRALTKPDSPRSMRLLLPETMPSRPDGPLVPQFEISHNVAALLTSCAADADEIIAAQESCGSIMSKRIDKSWLVFLSIENFDHDRCVDLFSRRDGSCGFEEFRRDVEDRGEWTPVRYYSGSVYTSQESALAWRGCQTRSGKAPPHKNCCGAFQAEIITGGPQLLCITMNAWDGLSICDIHHSSSPAEDGYRFAPPILGACIEFIGALRRRFWATRAKGVNRPHQLQKLIFARSGEELP
jgi:hypothetical protein